MYIKNLSVYIAVLVESWCLSSCLPTSGLIFGAKPIAGEVRLLARACLGDTCLGAQWNEKASLNSNNA